jgi:hypothetical protein
MLVRRGGIEIICNQQRFDQELKAQGYQIVETVKAEEKPAEQPLEIIEQPKPKGRPKK